MQPAASSLLPRSAALPRPLSFPILTLDERKLTPALGYVFSRKWLEPCESLVSILWKFERANSAPGHTVARLARPDIDPYEGIVPELGEVDINRLRENLLVPVATLQMALLQPSQRRRYSNVFRHCRRCMTHGYHSVLHQMESIRACPAHHRALETECRRCGYEAPYRVSVRLLEAPYRCASCRTSYGGQGWTPGTPLMKAEHRKAFTRRYFERHLG